MGHEHGGAAGAEWPADATGEMTRPVGDKGWTGRLLGVADLAWIDAEQCYESLFVQLEAEVEQIPASAGMRLDRERGRPRRQQGRGCPVR